MNYLAHFHLAGDDDAFIVGAFLGDFVKGPLDTGKPSTENFSAAIIQGILLHRKIDAYVDHLPPLKQLGNQLPKSARRYKGILVDLFFDYALTQHWQQFDRRPLEHYAANILDSLEQYARFFPPAALELYRRMHQYQLLSNYDNRDVINGILQRIGSRLGKEKEIEQAQHKMWRAEEQWVEQFLDSYPIIMQFADSERIKLLGGLASQ